MSEKLSLTIKEIEPESEPSINEEIKIAEPSIDDEIASMFDLGKKKKKAKDKDKKKDKDKEKDKEKQISESIPTYTYLELLTNLYNKLGEKESNSTNKFMIAQPIIQKISIKKVVWSNFYEICLSLNRPPEHLLLFITSELNTLGFINENKQMIIKGKYFTKNIEVVLRKYMCNYVQCNMCRSYKTAINRDISSRLNILVCSDCKSSRTIPNIQKSNIINN